MEDIFFVGLMWFFVWQLQIYLYNEEGKVSYAFSSINDGKNVLLFLNSSSTSSSCICRNDILYLKSIYH